MSQNKRRRGFFLTNGLIDDGHAGVMGRSLALFVWLVRAQRGSDGLVRRGLPFQITEVAEDLHVSVRTASRMLRHLETVARPNGDVSCVCGCRGAGYVRVWRHARGLRVQILHQKRWRETWHDHETSLRPARSDRSKPADLDRSKPADQSAPDRSKPADQNHPDRSKPADLSSYIGRTTRTNSIGERAAQQDMSSTREIAGSALKELRRSLKKQKGPDDDSKTRQR